MDSQNTVITYKEIGGTLYIVESIATDENAKKVIKDKIKDLILTNAKSIKIDTKYRAK
ncbi:MAG: hypothetical protein IJV78_05290 [Clostridia bacterium]|jgi:hypothetical protein|nr:hypothetical protein [Clostridia bacterium]